MKKENMNLKDFIKYIENMIVNGKIPEESLRILVTDVKDVWYSGKYIEKGHKYVFYIEGTRIVVKWHSPDLLAKLRHPGARSGKGWTVQIQVGYMWLYHYGTQLKWVINNHCDGCHIPLAV